MASKIIVDQIEKTGGSLTALTLPTSNASASEFLQNDGAGALSWASASAGFNSVQVFTASGTWTKPTDITKVIVEVQGAGGSGTRHTTGQYVCSGAGGGYGKKFLDVTNIDTVTVVIGAGGASQTSATSAGNAGGLSSFIKATGSGSFTDIIGNGGAGGVITGHGTSAAGGTGTGGDINIQGGRGYIWGGEGSNTGGSFLGVAGISGSYDTGTTLDGLGYGAGGGAAYTTAASGAGAPGIIIVWEYK